MATMFPPGVYTTCASPGERDVFQRLRDSPGTAGWTVLHSLDIAEHVKQVSGEADFVIIVPSKGVLVLEVKACTHLRREGGAWYYGARPNADLRGPFKQAAQAMHSIRVQLTGQRPDLRGVLFWSAVLFPYVDFSAPSGEWHPWQAIDNRSFRSRPIDRLVAEVLDQGREAIQGRGLSWLGAGPNTEQCAAIAGALRGNFEFFERPRARSSRQGEDLRRYTAEQFTALDAMEHNPRVAYVGPAGTGKTMLALEAARRASSAKRRVLVVCFNRLLGHWLGEQAAEWAPFVTARTLHSQMLSVAGIPVPAHPGHDFWDTVLPRHATERLLLAEGSVSQFDEILIDEAQDILRDHYLDFLDLSLEGGLGAGRWMLFGDFEKQAIYAPVNLSLADFLARRGGPAPVYSLRANCRNTPRVAELVHLLAGLAPRYSKVLRPDDGVEPEIVPYKDRDQEAVVLVQALERLYADGYGGQDIVILSPHATGACAAAIGAAPWKERMVPLDRRSGGHIGYGTIHAFKGMEAPAVVITGIEQIAGPEALALFYVAVTRALHRLVILIHEPVRKQLLASLLRQEDPAR